MRLGQPHSTPWKHKTVCQASHAWGRSRFRRDDVTPFLRLSRAQLVHSPFYCPARKRARFTGEQIGGRSEGPTLRSCALASPRTMRGRPSPEPGPRTASSAPVSVCVAPNVSRFDGAPAGPRSAEGRGNGRACDCSPVGRCARCSSGESMPSLEPLTKFSDDGRGGHRATTEDRVHCTERHCEH